MIREDAVGPGEIAWDPRAGVLDPGDLEGVDVVINLAGRSIATRWTKAARRQIYESRIHGTDRKSTRLNSSHVAISYAVFCLKKKNKTRIMQTSMHTDN